MIKKTIRSVFRKMGYDIVPTNSIFGDSNVAGKEMLQFGRHILRANKDQLDNSFGSEMLAPKTFDPSHPKYDAKIAKNYPGCFYNVLSQTDRSHSSRSNPVFQYVLEQKTMTMFGPNPFNWDFLCGPIGTEFKGIEKDGDYAEFQSKVNELDDYISCLNNSLPGSYAPGNVSNEDGMFLYFIVRMLKPRTIVQTGVSNGASCSYMTMALKHNDNGGRLYAIDIPAVYDAADPNWHQPKSYGVCIPAGKTSGWLIPEDLRKFFEFREGDAKLLLSPLLNDLGSVDLFYHDSDHSYEHMQFEFRAVLPFMNPHGLIVADDIAWSTVTWDFAAEIGCYAFNHRGSQGIVFL